MRDFNSLKIAVAGTGYVGLSIATLLSQHHQVTAVDIIPEKVELINQKKSPIHDEYIEKYNVKIPDLYNMGYKRNGCMFCGFGVNLETLESNSYQKLKETHPKQYAYFIDNFGGMMIQFDIVV